MSHPDPWLALTGSPLKLPVSLDTGVILPQTRSGEKKEALWSWVLCYHLEGIQYTKRLIRDGRREETKARHGGSVIPTLCEAEVGGSLEVRSSRSAWSTW